MVGWDAPHMFNMKFSSYSVDFSCARPVQYQHLTKEEWLNISTPLNVDGSFDKCNVFNLNWTEEIVTTRPNEHAYDIIPCDR